MGVGRWAGVGGREVGGWEVGVPSAESTDTKCPCHVFFSHCFHIRDFKDSIRRISMVSGTHLF